MRMNRGSRGEQNFLWSRSGQALAELAVFGSIFLMILGAVISYGLKYNYQQEAQMQAYRRALKIASDQNRASGSYMIMADKHIPDPADSFAVGSPTSIAAGASVTRTNQLDARATDAPGLPATVLRIQTSQNNGDLTQASPIVVMNAGFRIENNVPKANLEKYNFIFPNTTALSTSGTWVLPSDKNVAKICTHYTTPAGPGGGGHGGGGLGGGILVPVCDDWTINQLNIEDPCIGQMIDHDSCAAQAMMLVDVPACIKQCQRSTNIDSDPHASCNCTCICNEQTNAPNQDPAQAYDSTKGGAWYAAGWSKTGANYTFPALEHLFAFAGTGPKTMGLQTTNSVAQTERASSVHKMETSSQILTEESASWSDKTPKQLVTNDNLNMNTGFENTHTDPMNYAVPVTNTINTEVSGEVNRTLATEK